jgi:hypothetical protein
MKPPTVSIAKAADNDDQQLVVADGRRPDPPAAIFERATAHAGRVEPGADLLALLADPDTEIGRPAAVSARVPGMPDARLTPVAETAGQFLAGDNRSTVVPVAGIPGLGTKRFCGFCCPFRRERYYGSQNRILGFLSEPAEHRITVRKLPSEKLGAIGRRGFGLHAPT